MFHVKHKKKGGFYTMDNYVTLVKGENTEILTTFEALKSNRIDYRYIRCNGTTYDSLDYRPLGGGQKLYQKYIAEVDSLWDVANDVFIELAETFKGVPAPAPVPAPANPLGDKLTEAFLETIAKASLDDVIERVMPLLDDHIRQTYGSLPKIVKVETPTHSHVIKGVIHEKFETVLKFVNANIPVFLTGAAGTGKNVLCKQIAEALGLEFYFSNAVSQEYKLTGFIDANGIYHKTQFFEAFTRGGLFMLDEMDASIPEVLIILNAAIANGYFDFPTGREEAHKNFRVISAGNTFGTGADEEYNGRFQLDGASLDRFAVVNIDYSKQIEEAITSGNSELVQFAHEFRKACSDVGLKHIFSYRSLERISKLEGLLPLAEVLKTCLFKNLQKDDLTIIKNRLSEGKYKEAMK